MKKKTYRMLSMALGGIALVACGCRKPAETPAPSAPKPQKSTMQTAVEGFTGKTAVETGKKAEKRLEDINAKREEDIKELESF